MASTTWEKVTLFSSDRPGLSARSYNLLVTAAPHEIDIVLHPRHGPGLDQALALIPGIKLSTPSDNEETIRAISEGGSVLVTFDWDNAFIHPNLAWVQAISAGVDQFPLADLAASGVILTSARGVHTPAVAHHALALLFAAVRSIAPAIRRAGRGEWKPEIAGEVRGLTVTILGMGSIGSEIARLLKTFDVEVIGIRRHPEPTRFADEVVGPGQLVSACQRSDVLICALPETDETIGIIGSRELEAIGPGWLVNVGRGSSVDETALIDVLTTGQLRGAAIDVTATEPLPADSPLWDIENLLITPHMAWASSHLTPRLAALIEHNIQAFSGDETWRNRLI
jgi:D-2-hydroxyacid dehydrogenase (NADP+)